jgi:hypothetical protein
MAVISVGSLSIKSSGIQSNRASHRVTARRNAPPRPAPQRLSPRRSATQRNVLINQETSMLAKPEFEEGKTTKICRELFLQREADGSAFVSLFEIKEAIGENSVPYGALMTAIRRLRKENSQNWENDRGLGYRLRSSEESAESGKRHRERARKQFRTGLEKLKTADIAKMSVSARTKSILEQTVCELGLAATAPRTINNVSQRVERQHNELTAQQMVDALKESLTRKM